jgi:hypothetical protein
VQDDFDSFEKACADDLVELVARRNIGARRHTKRNGGPRACAPVAFGQSTSPPTTQAAIKSQEESARN